MPKVNTVKEIAKKVANNGNEADYSRVPIGADAENIDRQNGQTVEESLNKLETTHGSYDTYGSVKLLSPNTPPREVSGQSGIALPACEKDAEMEGTLAYQIKQLSDRMTDVMSCEHNYNESIIKDATCTEEGQKLFSCEKCGNSFNIIIPKVEHNFVDNVCTVCGKKYDPYEVAPADAYSNWNYTLDEENKTITLKYYKGNETDVIVYGNYVINGKSYKTKFNNNTGYLFRYI